MTPYIPAQQPLRGRRWLFIAARNFGDALITSTLVRAIIESFPQDRVEILSRPQFHPIFNRLPGIADFHVAAFPMGSVKEFHAPEALALGNCIRKLRRARFDCCVNDTGDVREAWLGRMIGPKFNVGPQWHPDNPHLNLIQGWWTKPVVNHPIFIPADVLNVYKVRALMASQLGCLPDIVNGMLEQVPRARSQDGPRVLGIQPYATQDCRLWPWEFWCALASQASRHGVQVRIFCAPPERDVTEKRLAPVLRVPGVELRAEPLEGFFRQLTQLTALVALDSFGIHAARSMGVPAVMINGANDPRLWQPPGTRMLSNGGNCPKFPCYCQPVCGGPDLPENACIREITPAQVWNEIRVLLFPEPIQNTTTPPSSPPQ
ncbi:MAG: lipopolysaccharide heptosyltransferase family protein [Pedosphaera sp.]|nr:lipopolysaccharide heptosyltransferase family protein [Pedosphaera sp.]